MFKLVKYELIGKSRNILGGIALLVLLNIFFEIGFTFWWRGGSEASLLCAILLGIVAFIAVGVDIISLLRRDLFGNTGYLVFTLPQSGYSILGAKLIAGSVELLTFVITQSFIILYYLIFRSEGFILKQFLESIPNLIPVALNAVVSVGSGFLLLLLMIAFSLVLTRSLLTAKKFGKIISFGIFIALTYGIALLDNKLRSLLSFASEIKSYPMIGGSLTLELMNRIDILFTLAISVVLFIVSGYLLDRKLEV